MPFRALLLFLASGVVAGTAGFWTAEALTHRSELLAPLVGMGVLLAVVAGVLWRHAMRAWGPPFRIRRLR